MFRAQYALLALVPALALGYSACASSGGVDEEAVTEQESAMVAPAYQPLGTFQNELRQTGKVSLLVLKSDGTYHLAMPVACVTAPCNPVTEDGRYSFSYRGQYAYVTLSGYDRTVERYQYMLRGDELRIMKSGATDWTLLRKTTNEAWCAIPNDCALQGLPLGICASEWHCNANVCSYPCRVTDIE